MAGLIALVLAAAVLIWTLMLKLREFWQRRQLVKVDAKLLDPGTMAHAAYRSPSNSDGSQPRTGEPSIWDSGAVYVAAWEYFVEGQKYQGEARTGAPCFTKGEMPPARVHVYYHREDPSKSWPSSSGEDRNVLPWFIFGCTVALVGVVLLLLGGEGPSGTP